MENSAEDWMKIYYTRHLMPHRVPPAGGRCWRMTVADA
jgi:hypothetical protein